MLVFILEEAHEYLNPYRQRREDFSEPPLESLIRRFRKLGIGFVLVDQVPSLLPAAAIGNLGTQVVLRLKNGRCVQAVAIATGLNQEQAAVLPLVEERRAIVQNHEIARATMIRVPHIERPEPPTHEELAAEMRAVLAQLPFTPVEAERAQAEHVQPPPADATADDGAAQQKPGARAETAAGPNDGARGQVQAPLQERARPSGLSLDALTYLKQQNERENQLLPLTVFDARLGWSAAKGNALRSELTLAGLVEVVPIRTGVRGAPMKVVKVLARGYETLKEMGVTVQARQGKGGIESQFWQLAIARWLVRTQPGIKPVIEDARLGKPMDVAVEQDGILRAFEVSLSPSWATQNAVKDLAAGADEVVVCAVSDEELREIRERLERELEPGGEWTRIQHRVSFRLLRSFLV